MSSKSVRNPGRPRDSLALRLTAWYSVASLALVFAVTTVLYWGLATTLDQEARRFIDEKLHIVDRNLQGPGYARLKEEVEWEWGSNPNSRIFVRVLSGSADSDIESPGMKERGLPQDAFPPPSPIEDGRGAMGTIRASQATYKATSIRTGARLRNAEPVVVQIALDWTPSEKLLAGYRRLAGIVFGTTIVLCVAIGRWIATRGLDPLKRVSAAIARIRSTTLHEHVDSSRLPLELSSLAVSFNDMLDRLQEAFERLSRFSADIAHELRTPINNVRGEIEVTLQRVRVPEDYQETLGSCLEECDRLSLLIDDLLFIARSDSAEARIQRAPVDVGAELARVVEFYEAAAIDRGVALSLRCGELPVAAVDRILFQRAVSNLVENALAHTERDGSVTIVANGTGHGLQVEVSDTGCGIAPEHRPRVFDRLYRVDASRAASSGGAGLGLAIVKTIARLHGGNVDLQSEVGRGTIVTITFPPLVDAPATRHSVDAATTPAT